MKMRVKITERKSEEGIFKAKKERQKEIKKEKEGENKERIYKERKKEKRIKK